MMFRHDFDFSEFSFTHATLSILSQSFILEVSTTWLWSFLQSLVTIGDTLSQKKKKKKKKKIKWSHTKCLVHGAQNKSNKTLFLFTIARFARLLAVRFSCSWLLIAVSGPKFYRNRRQRALLYRLALQPFYFYFPFNAGFVPATTVVKARQKPHLLHGFNAFMKKKKKNNTSTCRLWPEWQTLKA